MNTSWKTRAWPLLRHTNSWDAQICYYEYIDSSRCESEPEMPQQDLIHYFQQQRQGHQGGRITPNGNMKQNTLFATLMPHLPAYICVFGIASGIYLLQYHGDSGETYLHTTNILLTIPREQSQRQWWDILTYFLWYHGNSHRDSSETYNTMGTVIETVVRLMIPW